MAVITFTWFKHCCGIRMFITVITKGLKWILLWGSSVPVVEFVYLIFMYLLLYAEQKAFKQVQTQNFYYYYWWADLRLCIIF